MFICKVCIPPYTSLSFISTVEPGKFVSATLIPGTNKGKKPEACPPVGIGVDSFSDKTSDLA